MKQVLAVLVAALMAGSMGMTTAAMAQTKDQPARKTDQPAPKMEQKPTADKMDPTVLGKIKSVNAAGTMITLEDGTQLSIPKSLKVSKAELKQGAMIMARFQDKGGQKVVTSLEVKQAAPGGA